MKRIHPLTIVFATIACIALGVLLLAYLKLTFFLIPPSQYFKGATIVIARRPAYRLIDSPLSVCNRTDEGVTSSCITNTISSVVASGDMHLIMPYYGFLDRGDMN